MKSGDVRTSLLCGCQSAQVDILYAYVASSEELVSKALAISEVAQMARGEQRLHQYLLTKWRLRAQEAARSAGSVVHDGGTPAKATSKINQIMERWSGDVGPAYTVFLAKAYKLARVAGFKKASGKTTASLQYMIPEVAVRKAAKKTPPDTSLTMAFDVEDTRAIAALQKQEMLWIGEHYGENVSGAIKEGVNEKLIAGLGREAAGRIVREYVEEKLKGVYTPSGWRGSDDAYFEGLAANATTNARVQGQMESFSRVKVVRYEIVNPMDRRTTPFCNDMNGTIFDVVDGMSQLANLRAAKTPDQVREAHPWMTAAKMAGIKSKGGVKGLASAGLCFPPYHFRCRSTVDVASESMSYNDLEPAD